jgi:parallel beta-helix repeat protein
VAIANPFDTIIVRDGSYFENIAVTADNVTIRSENGSANCGVAALAQNDHVFNVTADWVTISGFRVIFAIHPGKTGIHLYNVDNSTLSENIAFWNGHGIYLYASSSNNLTGNTANFNLDDVSLLELFKSMSSSKTKI